MGDPFGKHLAFILRVDRAFREDFVDFLYEGNKVPQSVIDRLFKHFEGRLISYQIEEELMKLLRNRKMIPFLRVIRLTGNMRNSWSQRFRNVKFSSKTGIDLLSVSKSGFDSSHLQLFDNLNNEERSVLELFTIEEIDFLANFTPRGIHVGSMFADLEEIERLFILDLEQEEINVMIEFGFQRTGLLSRFNTSTRNVLFAYQANNSIYELNDLDFDRTQWLLTGIDKLGSGKRSVLEKLIDRKSIIINNLSILEGIDEFLEDLRRLKPEDLATILLLDEEQLHLLKNLSETERRILKRLDDRFLKVASTLTRLELHELLILPGGMLGRISSDVAGVIPEGKPISPGIHPLAKQEEMILIQLNPNKRTILDRIYNLPPSAVRILFNLDLDRIKKIMMNFQSIKNFQFDLNRAERFLLNTMESLSPEHRHDIAWMTNDEWNSALELRHINLSKTGIEVLKAMIPLSEDQLYSVINRSKFGLAVLPGNSKFIDSIMRLRNEEQGFFLDLNLESRILIEHLPKTLTPEGQTLLREMARLNIEEIWWAQGTNFESYKNFNKKGLQVLVNLFNSMDSVRESIFDIWEHKSIITEVSTMDPKLLANIIMAEKPVRVQPVGELGIIFHMEWLRLSIEDDSDEIYQWNIIKEIRSKGFNVEELARGYDYSNGEQVKFLRWIFMNSLKLEGDILFGIAQTILHDYLHGRNELNFFEIFHPKDKEIMSALRVLLKTNEYVLAQHLFFSTSDSVWLAWVFDSQECLDLLKSKVSEELCKTPYLLQQDVFRTFKTNKMKFSELLVYFDRGNVVRLLNKLASDTFVGFFQEVVGQEFIRSSLSYGRADLLRWFRQRLGLKFLRDMLKNDDYGIVRNLVDEVRSVEHVVDLTKTLQMIHEIDPSIPQKHYVDACSRLIVVAQKIAPPETIVSIVRTLSPRNITQYLLIPGLQDVTFGNTYSGCGFRNEGICIDSWDREEMRPIPDYPESMFLIFQHLDKRDVRGLGYNTLNLWTVPGRDAQIPLTNKNRKDLHTRQLKLKKLGEHIERLRHVSLDLYHSMFWDNGTIQPEGYLSEDVIGEYVSGVIDRFEDTYERIGISLPRWIVGKTEYHVNTCDGSCEVMTINSPPRLSFDRKAVVRNPFDGDVNSTLIFNVKDYHLVCGPKAIEMTAQIQSVTQGFDDSCGNPDNASHSRKSTERYRLLGESDDRCQNMVLYEKDSPTSSDKIMLFVAQDYFEWDSFINNSIDLLFLGTDISIVDSKHVESENHYLLKNQLTSCKIHKKGLNFFHTDKTQLICDLDDTDNGQNNVAVVYGDFTDTSNIRTVIGEERRNKIKISHASFVDGHGRNDIITAGDSTVVEGYMGDLIIGSASVLLSGSFDWIHEIKITPSTFMVSHESGAFIEMDRTCRIITANGYFVIPLERDSNRVRGIGLYKTSLFDVGLEKELGVMREMKNENFKLVKHFSSSHWDIILTELSDNIFLMDEDGHNYFWEGSRDGKNVYILKQPNGNVTISQASGILNFQAFNKTIADIRVLSNRKGGINILIKDVNIRILANYKDVAMTFNGQDHYTLEDEKFELDNCFHPLKVVGRISINSSTLIGLHNCLVFQADKVHFIKSNNDLVLVSDMGALFMHNYYENNLYLSLELNSRTLTPGEFMMRANNPTSIKFYHVERDLQIYHNQPENKYDIGYIDLRAWSISQCRLKICNNTLLIAHPNDYLVRVENWTSYQPAREVLLSFRYNTFLNVKCINSNCSPKYILDEFKTVASSPLCLANNLAIILFVFQNYLDEKCPFPVQRYSTPEEILADACNITEIFEKVLRKTAGEFKIPVDDIDFYNIYLDVKNLISEEKYINVIDNFSSIVAKVGLGGKKFLDTLKKHLKDSFME